ncbi:lysophospholipase [Mycobacterium sp. JS623]|uniref:alpha/beta hydrolase n=1 Tax=Mycobacterium sp. JS623 TaxID=212767 RepID=UPI0002A59AE2|nr:alpha/beta fold hydrolase [Mycobacterium sp. JS623]AGB25556.1 lysophospholipase [Mycobacterium sp. JS623]
MAIDKAPIVLIHGLWMSPHSWRGWIEQYSDAGHTVYAPAWPGVSELDEELDHTKAPAEIGVGEVVDHYAAFVRALPERPILMGHSFGGLITQLLLSRGFGRVGVAIHPAAPRGVYRLPLSVLRSTFPVFRNPSNRHRAVPLSPAEFHYVFANTVSREESDSWHTKLAIPGPGRPLFQVALANFSRKSNAPTAVDFTKPDRAPLLLIAGGRDHIVPPSVVYENFNRYRRSPAATDFKLFDDRPHLTAALDGWSDVADYALTWTAGHSG